MRKTLHILMIACGAAVFLHADQAVVQAGFIAATVDRPAGDCVYLGYSSASASAPSKTEPPDPLELLRRQLGFIFSFGRPASTTGMASNAVDGPTGPSSSATFIVAASTEQSQLVAWLGPEGKVWLPPPFLSGIFRPPRFAS